MTTEPVDLPTIISQLTAIADDLVAAGELAADSESTVPSANKASALNLEHYLEMRQRDMRGLQQSLASLGLSSLGRSEAHVQWSIEAALRNARLLAGRPVDPSRPAPAVGFQDGARQLAVNTFQLLGSEPETHRVRIMVTMPTEAASDSALIGRLLDAGMNCARINCAHDSQSIWAAMIQNIRECSAKSGRPCKILMDMAGPKLRTGEVLPGPPVVRVRPTRDAYGRVTEQASVWLAPTNSHTPAGSIHIPVDTAWLCRLQSGDTISFTDSRGRDRVWTVDSILPGGVLARTDRTAYITDGVILRRDHDDSIEDRDTTVERLPRRASFLHLRIGDRLLLMREPLPGINEVRTASGELVHPARICCTLPQVFADVRPGEPIWFDDGKIGGVIETCAPDEISVLITQTAVGGSRLRGAKGINLPETDLKVRALGPDESANLQFAIDHADIIGLSFAQDPDDVQELIKTIRQSNANQVGIVLKIETQRGFEALPLLLKEAMAAPSCGVMIARGDLAVECGYERLAEVQEEIMWLCEAAHIPVIWATQVLETLAQTGQPTRAEITDAAMSQRAECVMLNKGPFIVEAVELLKGILERMTGHQNKKVTLLRQLRSWGESEALAAPESQMTE